MTLIRRLIITALTLASVCTGALSLLSLRSGIRYDVPIAGNRSLMLSFYQAKATAGIWTNRDHPRAPRGFFFTETVLRPFTALHSQRGVITWQLQFITVPAWVYLPILAVWPVVAFLRGPHLRRRRRKRGLCVDCGYNLFGLPEPRCPECGLPTAPSRDPTART